MKMEKRNRDDITWYWHLRYAEEYLKENGYGVIMKEYDCIQILVPLNKSHDMIWVTISEEETKKLSNKYLDYIQSQYIQDES